jgi:hypothetical protein
MHSTGYGSARFLRACDIAAASAAVEGHGPGAAWRRLRAGSPLLTWYRLRLPSIEVRPSPTRAGAMIAEHFAIHERGSYRYRHAQGALPLPDEYTTYMRGRSRQAVRTNVARSRKVGFRIETLTVDDWKPGEGDSRAGHLTPGPVEWWRVWHPDNTVGVVAEAILSVDDDVALLHGLVSTVTDARWLLHTAIVERLCGSCGTLLVNSDAAYLLAPGTQHFQRLLGYQVARLRILPPERPRTIRFPAPSKRAWRPRRPRGA